MSDPPVTWLTAAAHEKLRHELHELETDGRRRVSERIAEARSHGDIRENAEYDAAKDEQGLIEARIRKLRRLLENAHVAEVTGDGTVQVGTLVTVAEPDGEQMEIFVAPAENKIAGVLLASPDSPLGSALIGAAPGDSVTYEAPAGSFTYEVVAIRPFEG